MGATADPSQIPLLLLLVGSGIYSRVQLHHGAWDPPADGVPGVEMEAAQGLQGTLLWNQLPAAGPATLADWASALGPHRARGAGQPQRPPHIKRMVGGGVPDPPLPLEQAALSLCLPQPPGRAPAWGIGSLWVQKQLELGALRCLRQSNSAARRVAA